MSSMETPPDPDEPEPTEEEINKAVKEFLFDVGILVALAATIVGYLQATGRIHFF